LTPLFSQNNLLLSQHFAGDDIKDPVKPSVLVSETTTELLDNRGKEESLTCLSLQPVMSLITYLILISYNTFSWHAGK